MTELIIARAIPDTALEPVGDGWTVYGQAVPYGVEQMVRDGSAGEAYVERFSQLAFQRDAARGGRWVNLMIGHRNRADLDYGDRFLGRCVELEDKPDGLYAAFRLNRDHPRAEEARAGELTGWSVSAAVYKSRRISEGGRVIVERVQCALDHVAATPSPQYANAGVLLSREHELLDEVPVAPRRDALRRRYGLLS